MNRFRGRSSPRMPKQGSAPHPPKSPPYTPDFAREPVHLFTGGLPPELSSGNRVNRLQLSTCSPPVHLFTGHPAGPRPKAPAQRVTRDSRGPPAAAVACPATGRVSRPSPAAPRAARRRRVRRGCRCPVRVSAYRSPRCRDSGTPPTLPRCRGHVPWPPRRGQPWWTSKTPARSALVCA
jgi:hypothetical protein